MNLLPPKDLSLTYPQVMLQRLEKVRPMYRITDWIDDWQRSEELTQRITAFPTPSHAHSAPVSETHHLMHLCHTQPMALSIPLYILTSLAVRVHPTE